MNFDINQITSREVEAITAISQDVGWNQPAEEIEEIIERSGKYILGAFKDNELAGVAAAYCYPDKKFAFVNEVIVHSNWRKNGIATQLLNKLMPMLLPEYPTLRLYATDMGRPVYEKLGFTPYGTLSFVELDKQTSLHSDDIIRGTAQDIPAMCDLDEVNFGARREALIKQLFEKNPEECWCIKRNGQLEGFILDSAMSWFLQSKSILDMTDLIRHANYNSGMPQPVLMWKNDAEALQLPAHTHFELTAMQYGNTLPPPQLHHSGTLPDIG